LLHNPSGTTLLSPFSLRFILGGKRFWNQLIVLSFNPYGFLFYINSIYQ
jgi:hypothetical protein